MTEEEILFMYGKNVVISSKGRFTLVHLDCPSAEVTRARTENFNPDEFFKCDCRVCDLTKKGGVIIFDDSAYEDADLDRE